MRIIATLAAVLLLSACAQLERELGVDREPEVLLAPATQTGRVTKVVDGDTLDALSGDVTMRVRVIGINTPESVDPRRPVECFGKEASAHARELLAGTEVTLTEDPTQDREDKYDRQLRYVTLSDGRDFGETMIRDGYAHEYTYDRPYQRRDAYRAAQTAAMTAKAGLWADDTCAGDTKKPAK